ncbi:STAS/SEC14 domain-containing protein [Burkholderia cepacia]|uniref:STAS/SEC14 domain-containing protein n=1 Tax=Burkholderia cepacia TaxID=292 RepID=UPI0021481F1A|nr:STAS/SEC14 domain-containing protein [Burkholderia cepacia]
MIEKVNDLPDGIAGFIATGQVTRKDYEDVLIPAMEAILRKHAKVRLYYELGADFSGMDPGAAWEDFKLGVQHITQWERIAVVTNVEWVRFALAAFRFVIPGEVRVFSSSDRVAARAWIIEHKSA